MENKNHKKSIKANVLIKYNQLFFELRYTGLPIEILDLEDDYIPIDMKLKSKLNRKLIGELVIPTSIILKALKSNEVCKYGPYEIKKNSECLEIYFSQMISMKKVVQMNKNYEFSIRASQNKKHSTNLVYSLPHEAYSILAKEFEIAKKLNKVITKKK